jgi:hypothetical protein
MGNLLKFVNTFRLLLSQTAVNVGRKAAETRAAFCVQRAVCLSACLALCLMIKQERIVWPFDFLAFVAAYLDGGNWVLSWII